MPPLPTPLPLDIFAPTFASANGETIDVLAGETVLGALAPFAVTDDNYDGVTVNNAGIIDGINGAGVQSYGVDFTLNNSATGYIAGAGAGVVLEGAGATMFNDGIITGGSAGVVVGPFMGGIPIFKGLAEEEVLEPVYTHVTNNNLIAGSFTGMRIHSGDFFDEFAPADGDVVVDNNGIIAGGYQGMSIAPMGAMRVAVNNSGTIAGEIYGISVESMYGGEPAAPGPVLEPEAVVEINNSGLIIGQTGVEIHQAVSITNTADGAIVGTDFGGGPLPVGIGAPAAIYAGGAPGSSLSLDNAGLIDGNIDLSATNSGNTISNSGVIDGNVLFGTGNDSYTAEAGSTLNGAVYGWMGNDTIMGHSQGDAFYGDAGEDYLKGRGGDDYLSGGADNDRLIAGGGNDTLVGGEGDDRLVGNQGDNVMNGGLGADMMRAGSGTDTFVWTDAMDSGVIAGEMDRIKSFEIGVDMLDFTALSSDGNLYFEADEGLPDFVLGAPSGSTTIEITDNGTHSYINVDINNDGSIDMIIEMRDTLGLSASDFVGGTEIFPV